MYNSVEKFVHFYWHIIWMCTEKMLTKEIFAHIEQHKKGVILFEITAIVHNFEGQCTKFSVHGGKPDDK